MTTLLVIVLTWLSGAWLVAALDARGRRYDMGLYLALGFLPGCAMAAAGLSVFKTVGINPLGWTLAMLAVIQAFTMGWWLREHRLNGRQAKIQLPAWTSLRQSWPVWLPISLVLIGAALLVMEGLGRPIYPWDAWSAWAVKAKVWHALGLDIDFVSFSAWWSTQSPVLYTNEAWIYPELLPLIQYWGSAWTGEWSDARAVAWWAPLWLSLLATIGLGLRRLGVPAIWAAWTAFAIAATPIVATQVALPGYADIWVAAALLGVSVGWALWLRERRAAHLVLVMVNAVALIGLKLEGTVWFCVLAVAFAYTAMPDRARRVFLLVTPIVVIAWWLAGGITIELGNGQMIALRPDLLQAPYLGRYPMEASNPGPVLAHALFALPNWQLLWYVLPPIALIGCWLARRQPLGRAAMSYLVLGATFLFVLFFLTHASTWVESMTASNRLLLQYAPAALFWSVLAMWHGLNPTAQPSTSA